MKSSGLCLQYFNGMGNSPGNCQWMKLEIGNFEKIVFGNLLLLLLLLLLIFKTLVI
jgi:hypothetical protein